MELGVVEGAVAHPGRLRGARGRLRGRLRLARRLDGQRLELGWGERRAGRAASRELGGGRAAEL